MESRLVRSSAGRKSTCAPAPRRIPTNASNSSDARATAGARPHRLKPAELIGAWRREARHARQIVIDREAHHQTGRLPSAGDEAAELRVARGFGIDVERLRIVSPRELDDLRLADGDRSQLVNAARNIVFEIAFG